MDLLVDTNVFLWTLTDHPRLGSVRAELHDERNRVYVSVVSVWEIIIKAARGKLDVPANAAAWIPAGLDATRFTPLQVTLQHALRVEMLPLHHHDPFDRLLLAQAAVEDLTLVTSDHRLERYNPKAIWC